MEEREERDERFEAGRLRQPEIEPGGLHDLDLEKVVIVLVHGGAPCPQGSVLPDDVLSDLELAREPEALHVAARLRGVQAEARVVPPATLVRSLREVLDADLRAVRAREFSDDPSVADLVGHLVSPPLLGDSPSRVDGTHGPER
jgi:hypothetical protein